MIALLCAVQTEAEHILVSSSVFKSSTLGSKAIIEGRIGGQSVLLCIGGVGKANAAHATTLLALHEPEALIIFGIGGAYPGSGAIIGDVVLAREEIAGDDGVLTRDGFKDFEYIGIPLLKTTTSVIYTTYPASESSLEKAFRTLGRCPEAWAQRVRIGSFVTLSTCTGTIARALELEHRYHSLCENMEGSAAAQVAALHGIPWLEVRGISNIVEDRNPGNWNIPAAALAAQQAVRHIVEDWNE